METSIRIRGALNPLTMLVNVAPALFIVRLGNSRGRALKENDLRRPGKRLKGTAEYHRIRKTERKTRTKRWDGKQTLYSAWVHPSTNFEEKDGCRDKEADSMPVGGKEKTPPCDATHPERNVKRGVTTSQQVGR